MSDITKLTDKIIQDAQAQKEKIIQTGQIEIDNQLDSQKKQLDQQLETRIARYEKIVQADLNLRKSDANVQSRSQILSTRQDVLNEIFSEAREKLANLSTEEFTQFVKLNLAKADFEGDAEIILGSHSQKHATKEAIEEWKAATDLNLKISSEVIPNSHGFILKQDYLELNFLFEALLNASEEELSVELLKLIFA